MEYRFPKHAQIWVLKVFGFGQQSKALALCLSDSLPQFRRATMGGVRGNAPGIPTVTEQELRQAIKDGLAELAAEPIVCCAKVVWNDPYQLKYVDPFGDGTVIRVNWVALTDAGAMEEAEAILEQRHPGVEWCIA